MGARSTGAHFLLSNGTEKLAASSSCSITSRRPHKYTGPWGSLCALWKVDEFHVLKQEKSIPLQCSHHNLIYILSAEYLCCLTHILPHNGRLIQAV